MDIETGTELMVFKNTTGVDSGAIVTVLSAMPLWHPSGVSHRVVCAADNGEWFGGYVYSHGQAKPRVSLTTLADPIRELALTSQ